MEYSMDELLSEERELVFSYFNEKSAWIIGSWLYETAKTENLPITIDINLSGRRLFHVACPGTSVDNDAWIERKVRMVNRTGHSSLYTGIRLKNQGKTVEAAMLLPESEYAPHGGSFPIIIKNTGPVGTITVSGLSQEEDHRLVTKAIRYFHKEEESI